MGRRYIRRALRLDREGDLVMERGQLQEIEGLDELVQRFRQLFRTNKGEWFLSPEEGLDRSVLFQKIPDEEEIRLALEDVAEQIEEIERIQDIEIDFERSRRELTVFFVAVLETGEEIEMEEVL